GRIDVRQAEPVHCTVTGDQCGRAAVAHERVLADRGIAVDSLHGPDSALMPTPKPRPRCRNRHALSAESSPMRAPKPGIVDHEGGGIETPPMTGGGALRVRKTWPSFGAVRAARSVGRPEPGRRR